MSPILGGRGAGVRAYGFGGAAKPNAPVSVVATDVGTNRAYNNGAASVAFSSGGDNGLPITSYTVTSSPGSFTATGSSSPLTITGLQSSVQYTYTVTATNAIGTSSASSASAGVTATTVPQAPTIGTATATGATTATVAYTANGTGGKAVSAYTATSSPGSLTGSGASAITVSGLTTGTAYTFTVTATNANGTSTASSSSNSITPAYSYAISSWTLNTVYPQSITGARAVSQTSNGAFFKNKANAFSYIWNGSSWSGAMSTSSVSGNGTKIARTSNSEAQCGAGRDTGAVFKYWSSAANSWSATNNYPGSFSDNTGLASLGGNSVRTGGGWLNFNASYSTDSYYRIGTGNWTQGTSMPVAREYTATDTGTLSKMVFTAWGATASAYTTTSLDGGWTTITASPYVFMEWFTLNNTNACAYYFNGSTYVYAILNDNSTYTVIGNAASVGSWANSGTWAAAAVGTTISQAGGSNSGGTGTLHYTANTI
jgi:trimeric autotransporter adhesin